jgi:hypothetical protein
MTLSTELNEERSKEIRRSEGKTFQRDEIVGVKALLLGMSICVWFKQ